MHSLDESPGEVSVHQMPFQFHLLPFGDTQEEPVRRRSRLKLSRKGACRRMVSHDERRRQKERSSIVFCSSRRLAYPGFSGEQILSLWCANRAIRGSHVSFNPWSCRFVRPWFCSKLSLREKEARRILSFQPICSLDGEAWFRRKTSPKVEMIT